jgi:hypothetical protein
VNILQSKDINQVHYKYREVATTAVPANVFASGQPVVHHLVHVDSKVIARAPVVPHPTVNPMRRAALPGRPVSAPPVHHPNVVRTARNAPPPLVNRNHPPVESGHPPPSRPPVPSAPPHPAPPPPIAHPEFHPKVPPPPPPVPFADRRPPMMEHPGRPLEPQQLDNLRAERPPGPMRDEEFPHHVAPVVPERPAPPPHPAPVIPAHPRKP